MQIVAVRWRHLVKSAAAVYPRVILEQGRGWTDFAPPDTTVYETLYDVYFEDAFERRTLLGSIKILKSGQPATRLRGQMESLPEDCCSLGQTIDYYEAVEKLNQRSRFSNTSSSQSPETARAQRTQGIQKFGAPCVPRALAVLFRLRAPLFENHAR